MPHINHYRTVEHRKRSSLSQTIDRSYPKSFAVFCGDILQRLQVCTYEMSALCGRMGIVLVHNNLQVEAFFHQSWNQNAEVNLQNSSCFEHVPAHAVSTRSWDNSYDPFYGLDRNSILDLLTSNRHDIRSPQEYNSLRSTLNDYLEISENLFYRAREMNLSDSFGIYPYNLDLLLYLTELPFTDLSDIVLQSLSPSTKRQFEERLSGNGIQQKAHDAVIAFSTSLPVYFWSRRPGGVWADHSMISIINAVRNREIISIYVPDSAANVLDYLALELNHLVAFGVPFLLISNGIQIKNSKSFKQLFLNDHSALSYYTGIIAEDLTGVIDQTGQNQDLAALFNQLRELFVFRCSNIAVAQPFSDIFGSYHRVVEEYHKDSHRDPFHFFASHSHGQAQRETIQNNITPEELTQMYTGCLFFRKDDAYPMIIDRFDFS